jgi:hypothetical protein
MRVSICTVAFLVLTSLARAQGSSIGPGQTSCEHFWNRQNILLTGVQPALELAMHGGKLAYGGG